MTCVCEATLCVLLGGNGASSKCRDLCNPDLGQRAVELEFEASPPLSLPSSMGSLHESEVVFNMTDSPSDSTRGVRLVRSSFKVTLLIGVSLFDCCVGGLHTWDVLKNHQRSKFLVALCIVWGIV